MAVVTTPAVRPTQNQRKKVIFIFFSFSRMPRATIFAVDPTRVILPPKHPPNRSAHQRGWMLALKPLKLWRTGMNAATRTTLSRMLEPMADIHRTIPVSILILFPVKLTSFPASTSVAPVYFSVPAWAKRSIKKRRRRLKARFQF